MDYDQLREILVNTESLYNLWKSTGLDEEEFIRANGKLIEQTEKVRLQKEQARARQVKFFEKQKASGKKFLSAMVSASTYDRLCRERDNSIQAGIPKNLGEILDELISGSKPDPKPKQAADKLDVIQKIAEHRAAGQTWPAIATALNEKSIFTSSGVAWTGPNCSTFFKRSYKS